jgi:4'-phosphopantetheinyl transferase
MTNYIEINTIRIEAPASVQITLQSLLDAEETERFRRFHRDGDREQFVIAHGTLRVLLARILNRHPRDLALKRGVYGKPYIPDCDLRFNMSHSGSYAVIAMARHLELGIDIEAIDKRIDADGLAHRYFHRDEIQDLEGLAPSSKQLLFFRFWARKEARVKALGLGLRLPLDTINTSSRSPDPSWITHDLIVAPGYAVALAYQGVPRDVIQLPVQYPTKLLTACSTPARCKAF